MSSKNNHGEVQRALDQLRDKPVGGDLSEDTLKLIYDYLMEASTGNGIHWFCGRASTTTVAAATFSLRLHAYESENVVMWRSKMSECLSNCTECVQAEEQAKILSANTYLGAFPADIKTMFFDSFEQSEADGVVDTLARAGLATDKPPTSKKSLYDMPPALVYRMVSNFGVFRDQRILSIIDQYPPSKPLSWPLDLLPAGMLILLLHRNPLVRDWATKQVAKCTAVPLPNDSFNGPYSQVLQVIASIYSTSSEVSSPDPHSSRLQAIVVSDTTILWSSFIHVLKLIPPESLVSGSFQHVDIRRVVTGHLHDTGPEFAEIMQCFTLLIKRLGPRIWVGEGPEYPQVIFDSIKDNPSFIDRIQESGGDKRHILWFREYLSLIRDASIHSQVCLKMLSFLCEELQHARFGDSRAAIMAFAAFLLKSEDKQPEHQAVVSEAFRIHGEVLTSVAFSKTHSSARWADARSQTRDLIAALLGQDLKTLSSSLTTLCEALARRKPTSYASAPTIRDHIWRAVYNSLQDNDSEGIHIVISVMSQASHLDTIHTAAFQPLFAQPVLDQLFRFVKAGIPSIKTGFLDAVTSHCQRMTTSSAISLLEMPGMVKDIMKMMLSPVDDLRMAAQSVVGSAFDVDVRADCFRALLTNHSTASLEGIFDFLFTFKDYANIVPEACSLAKALVRGFTDIMEILCQHPNGLLHQTSFLRISDSSSPILQLPKLWTMMSQAIALIFKRTPAWAKYFDNDGMITWMRDALIFGREMLSEVQTFQSVARSVPSLSKSRRQEIETNMLNDMQQVLTDLARWLRLTDEELLHQSYSLLESLFNYFRDNGTVPHKDSVDRLQRYLKDARDSDASAPRTRLSSTKLTQLDLLLSSFNEVIEIPDDEEGEPSLAPIVISDDDEPVVSKVSKGKGKDVKRPIAPPISSKPLQTKLKLPKSSTSTAAQQIKQAASSSTKTRVEVDKGFFGEREQKKLAGVSSLPKFRKSSAVTAGSSRPAPRGASDASGASSDNESSDEDEDDESQASALRSLGLPKSPKIKKKPLVRRQIKTLEVSSTSTAAAEERIRQQAIHAAKLRAWQRQNPNMTNLHRVLLSWNYDHDGPLPPGAPLRTNSVPDQFKEHRDYANIFEPLLFYELWAQISNSKEQTSESFPCKISSKSTADFWTKTAIDITVQLPKDWYLTENDVVLLRHQTDRSRAALAKVEESKSNIPPQIGLNAHLKFCFDENRPDPGLGINTSWNISKVVSLSTVSREYAALATVDFYEYKDVIYQPRLTVATTVNARAVQKTMETYKLNEPQAKAIECSLQSEGFSLIQGPPGTGKTSTICGLISAATERRPRPLSTNRSPPAKILVCAPSNAAIDEIAYRLKEGYRGSVKSDTPVKVVRLGSGVGEAVRDVELNFLVDQALGLAENGKDQGTEAGLVAMRQELQRLNQDTKALKIELDSTHDNSARVASLNKELAQLTAKRQQLGREFDKKKDERRDERKAQDKQRRNAQAEVLQNAEVICTTLSGAGHKTLQDAYLEFDVIIIDEAAQAIELSTLIPLKFPCKRCILVGDPNQLPPTVLSGQAARYLYNQSLFVRLQKRCPQAVHLLSIQYRMHPEISVLPSKLFYDGKLSDGPDMAAQTAKAWHSDPKFGPYKVFNVAGNEESTPGKSMRNTSEAQMVLSLYNRLQTLRLAQDVKVGVISPYRGQIGELKGVFLRSFGPIIFENVTFNTVDGFQGQEKDIIILSTVRAGPGVTNIGFLNDVRRMNVALTRAKSSVFVVGNTPTLERSDKMWKQIVEDARSRGLLVEASKTFFTESSIASTAPPLQTKKSLKSIPPPPPLPADLSTPSEVAAKSRSDGSRTVSGLKRKLSISAEDRPGPSTRPTSEDKAPTITSSDPLLPVENGHSRVETPSSLPKPPNTLPPKPQNTAHPPHAKKRKKGTNIFIPKKHQEKRPPHGDPGASSSVRRRPD